MKDIDELLNKTLAANDRVNENLKESILARASKYEQTKAQTVPFVSFQFRISLALAILLILSAAAFAEKENKLLLAKAGTDNSVSVMELHGI